MITKAEVRKINKSANRCIVRMPLFETASSTTPVEAEALVSITPGMFNNIFVGDIVFVAFEENALEKPIIIGKLFRGIAIENETPGGAAVVDTLNVRTKASTPAADTHFRFNDTITYKHFETPKMISDYILWLEMFLKNLINKLDGHFRCFKNWTQWQLRPENVEIDDGDIDTGYHVATPLQYQEENKECKLCGNNCSRSSKREYKDLGTYTKYGGGK